MPLMAAEALGIKRENPDSLDLQYTILGSLIAHPKTCGGVLAVLDADDFSEGMGTVFRAIRELFRAGDPIDDVTLRHRLDPDPDADSVWPDVIRGLRSRAVENPLPYCRMLHDNTALSELRAAAAGVYFASDIDEARSAAEGVVSCLSDRHYTEKTSAQDAVDHFWTRMQQKRDFVEWGLDALDNPCTHTSLGDYVILGGYPSAGKSMLALQLAQHLAEKFRVGYFSVEMSDEDIEDRGMARMSGVPLSAIQEQRCTEAQKRALAAASEHYYALRFDVLNAAGMTVGKIEAETLAGRYQVIVVDYMQILSAPGAGRFDKVTEISIGLHNLARKHHVLVIALSQLARVAQPKDDKPTPPDMSSLRESGQLEQDADLIWLLYLDNPKSSQSRRVLKTAKNRKGRRAPTFYLAFDGDRQLFKEEFPAQRPRKTDPGKRAGDRREAEQTELPM